MHKIWICLLSLFIISKGLAQQKNNTLDSLLGTLKKDLSDIERVDTYTKIIEIYRRKSDSTQLVKYANESIRLSKKIKYPQGIVEAYYNIGNMLSIKGYQSNAIETYQKAFKIAEENNYAAGQAKVYRGLGSVYWRASKYQKALENYTGSLKIEQKTNNLPGIGSSYHGLGLVSYSEGNYKQSLEYSKQALAIYQKTDNQLGISQIYNNLGIIYQRQSDYPKAIDIYRKSLKIAERLDNKYAAAFNYNNIGTIYSAQGNYPLALSAYFKALKIREKLGNKPLTAQSYHNIGTVYSEQDDYARALQYHFKSLDLNKQLGKQTQAIASHNAIGTIYQLQKQYDKALGHYKDALKIAQQVGNKHYLAQTYQLIGEAQVYLKKYNEASNYLLKAIEIGNQLGDKSRVANASIILGRANQGLKKYVKAIKQIKRGLKIAQEIGHTQTIKSGAQYLAQTYGMIGNFESAYKAQVLFTQMKDSLKNKANTKQITQLAANYKFEKEKDSIRFNQEKERVALNAKLAKEKLASKLQRNINWFISFGLLAVIVFAVFIFRSRQKQKLLNNTLSQQSAELTEMNEELQQNQEEITTQRDDIEQKNYLLNQQNDKITQSIKAARTIQEAILPFEQRLSKEIKEHFIIYKPRDIVSGDFYWLGNVGDKRILGVIDCTGHGIPGAFMSMIGFTLLNEIINTQQISDAAQVLEKLRKEIHHALKQDYTGRTNGMDAAFITLEDTPESEIKVTFAGAKRPLWYIEEDSPEVQVIKGSSISVGMIYNDNRVITNQTFLFKPGTILYLGSDGFTDQNDVHRKKFGTNRLKRTLYKNREKSLNEQKQLLQLALEEHMRYTEQRDDILLWGIKL
ncbi:hypothetical protein BKI52_41610 [marine bacterium AO1-C]|nr:hypothetical protein BKI52_41610 [marine bacterium AO1-C]